jgi:acyl carrier protein
MSEANGGPPGNGSVRGQIREYIEANFMYLEPELDLSDGDDLLELGVIDSLGFVELVEEVQALFDLAVEDIEITEKNFGSVDGIVAFVESKQAS